MIRVHFVAAAVAVLALGACKAEPKGPEPPPDVAAAPADAKKTDHGVTYKVLAAGDGSYKPGDADAVRIEYAAWTRDGKPFASKTDTPERPAPSIFLSAFVPGLREVIKDMVRGEQRRIWLPAKLADKGWPTPPSGEALTTDIKVLHVLIRGKEIPPPKDVGSIPDDAQKSKSGLAWKVLKEGTGKVHPKAEQTAQVHYSLWTTDGKMLESSIANFSPAQFEVKSAMPGWAEGIQLMVEGEKRRFWIPEDLTSKPQGMLVTDIELLKIQP